MKKYITIAALLAAGTAFANAADLIAQWNDFSDLTSDLGKTTLSVNLGTNGATYANGVLSLAAITNATDRANITLTDAISFSTGFSVVIDVSGFPTTGGNYVIADMTGPGFTGKSGDNGLGFGHGNTVQNGSTYKWVINNGGTFKSDGASTPNEVSRTANPSTIIFTFDGSTMNLYVGGTLARKDTSLNGTATNATFNKLALGGYATANVMGSAMNVEKLAIYSGALSATEIAAGGYVPEPSAFGLLAGIGALALIASRRRRK